MCECDNGHALWCALQWWREDGDVIILSHGKGQATYSHRSPATLCQAAGVCGPTRGVGCAAAIGCNGDVVARVWDRHWDEDLGVF